MLRRWQPFAQTPWLRITAYWLAATASSINSQLPSVYGGRLLHSQPKDAPCRGHADPHDFRVKLSPQALFKIPAFTCHDDWVSFRYKIISQQQNTHSSYTTKYAKLEYEFTYDFLQIRISVGYDVISYEHVTDISEYNTKQSVKSCCSWSTDLLTNKQTNITESSFGS
jgi:hypothetical protein